MANASSYISSPDTLDIPNITFPELLGRLAAAKPDKAAYIFIDDQENAHSLTYRELYEKASKFARVLVSFGIMKGDKVALSGGNVPEWLIANFGIQMAGGCSLCFPFAKKEGEDIIELFQSIPTVKMLIFDPGQSGRNCEIVNKIADYPSADGHVDSTKLPALKRVILFNQSKNSSISCTVNELCTRQIDMDLPRIDPEDIGLVLLTSGSTGKPKGVPNSHRQQIIMSWLYMNGMPQFNEVTTFYNDRPFSWMAGYPQWELATGCTRITLCNPLRYDSIIDATEATCAVIGEHKPTYSFLVPSVLESILTRNMPLKTKAILTGGTTVSSSLFKSVEKLCDELYVAYGMTEIGAIATRMYTLADTKSIRSILLSCRPLPGTDIKVTDANGLLVPVGQKGLIHIRSTKRFDGYINDDDESRAKEQCLKNGWLCFNDYGYVTEDKELIIEGRGNDAMEVYGSTVFPYEIEKVITENKNVFAAIVLPVKDKTTGDRLPSAAVVYKPGSEESKESMQNFIREQLNISKDNQLLECLFVPRIVVSFSEFPRLLSGKPDREGIKKIMQQNVEAEKYSFF